ncbi:MAG: AAA family ATPase, partial [Acidobacteriia bacterium]|nr:AAA family ATPase [Terriglobia bacterium]
IERILGHLEFEFSGRTYKCTDSELADLGRAFDPKQKDEHSARSAGARQFKTTLKDLKDLFRKEQWLHKNCLIAVSGGLGDGTSGLQEDDSYAATRREIERFANIIFSSTPSQRDFWLGKKEHANPAFIEAKYGALKPCLHGSDAHDDEKIGAPDLDRYCWIKGDLAFETLRQAVIEPEERVSLGNSPPPYAMQSSYIGEVHTLDASWLTNHVIELNSGLVAVIGARGSGKTALVDIVASGADSFAPSLDDSSFLNRAVDYLQDAKVGLVWGDDTTTTPHLLSEWQPDPARQRVCYLSQHFVERLCSSAGLATELRREMERVVFETTDAINRMDAGSFQELAGILLDPIHRRREELERNIKAATESIVHETLLRNSLPKLEKERSELSKQIEKDRKELAALLPKDKEQRAKRLSEVEQAYSHVEAKIELLRRRQKRLEDLAAEIIHIRTSTEPARLADMQQRFLKLQFSDSEWANFAMKFMGDVDALVKNTMAATDGSIKLLAEGNALIPFDKSKTLLNDWPLKTLKDEKEAIKKEVGIDFQKQKKYEELQRAITQKENTFRRLESDITSAQGAQVRRDAQIASRRADYTRVFSTFVEEQEVLDGLYAPLLNELADAKGALTKLQFVVKRHVDLDAWVQAGEQLLDLRKASEFQGHGALKNIALQALVPVWTKGTADEVGTVIDAFRAKYMRELVNAMPIISDEKAIRKWQHSIADWLYGTSHVRVQYGIQYDGVAIEQLSPGTRGIVLLLLYLAVDRQDFRPLIVDQPEENLDPHSVFQELVPHFREARKRRQIIIVTHNANLVVNTDVDQVIVASSVQTTSGTLPNISYKSGSLENPEIRRSVCEILEGGERAFLERERRYRLHWGDEISLIASE